MQLVFLHPLKLGNSINLQLGCISLLKSKSGFLIPKWSFFTKIQQQIIDPNDPQWGGFFRSYPKPDALNTWSKVFLYYRSEKSEYCQW